MNLKSKLTYFKYVYLMTEEKRAAFRLENSDIPRFRTQVLALTLCTPEEVEKLIEECRRITKVSAWDIHDVMDIVELNFIRGTPYKAVLAMLKGWFKGGN